VDLQNFCQTIAGAKSTAEWSSRTSAFCEYRSDAHLRLETEWEGIREI